MIGVLLFAPGISTAVADSTQTAKIDQALDRALIYLSANYNETIGLIHECPSADDAHKSDTYWLYSDNFLASLALKTCRRSDDSHVQMAEDIWGRMLEYLEGLEPVNPYMVFNHSTSDTRAFNPIPPEGILLNQSASIEIRTHQSNFGASGPLNILPIDYADMALLETIHLRDENETRANAIYDDAIEDPNSPCYFDNGIGFIDQGNTENYQTYKLALYIYASEWLGRDYDLQLLDRLFDMQQPEGGFRTGYDADFTPKELNNTETTSLVILALDLSSSNQDSLSWVYYALPIAVLIACVVYVIWRKLRNPEREE